MVMMDVENDESVQNCVDGVLAKAGRIDAVVNNAGISIMGSVEDTSIEEAKAQLETNFFGVLRVCRATLPILRKQGGGHIVNISSLGGLIGLPFSGLYSASKFALEGVSESLRMECRQFGVRVVLVEPGDFRTNITARRRTVRAAETNDAYRAAFEHCKRKQDQDEANARSPRPSRTSSPVSSRIPIHARATPSACSRRRWSSRSSGFCLNASLNGPPARPLACDRRLGRPREIGRLTRFRLHRVLLLHESGQMSRISVPAQ